MQLISQKINRISFDTTSLLCFLIWQHSAWSFAFIPVSINNVSMSRYFACFCCSSSWLFIWKIHQTYQIFVFQNLDTVISLELFVFFQDFHVDIYFQEIWSDERLKHPNHRHVLIKEVKTFDKMWHPDLYFANARTSEFHYVTAPNFFAYVYPNGTVYYDTRWLDHTATFRFRFTCHQVSCCRISLTVMCMMNLFKYPLDTQTCDIRILSCKPFA